MSALDAIKKKLEEKKLVIGTTVSLNDNNISELFAYIGFDFVWIESEHSSQDKRDIQQHLIAVRGSGAAAFVRVAWNDPVLVKPILDMGADGIVFPFIKTAEDARLAVGACRYPPAGVRGYGPLAATRYGGIDALEYIRESDRNIWKIIQIENVEAVDNIDDILQVDGVDAILVGPNDLSASIGLLGQTDHIEVKKLYDRIGEAARRHGKPLGVAFGYNPVLIREWIDRGCSWIIPGGDVAYLRSAALEALEGTRKIFAGQSMRREG